MRRYFLNKKYNYIEQEDFPVDDSNKEKCIAVDQEGNLLEDGKEILDSILLVEKLIK